MTYAFDPEIAPVVPLLPTLDGTDPAAARAFLSQMIAELPAPDMTGVQFEDRRIPGGPGDLEVTIRVYRPAERSAPAAVYSVHGGGFISGDLDTEHALNVRLARELGVVVVAVDYRLAPETPFPGPLEDVYADSYGPQSTPTSLASIRCASPSTAPAPEAGCVPGWRCWPATGKARISRFSSWRCPSSTTGSPPPA